jgi:DNA processing protein
VALSQVKGLGAIRFRKLEKHFPDLERAWAAGPRELHHSGLEDGVVSALVEARNRISPDNEMDRLEQAGVQALTWREPAYPPRLQQIDDPPPVLYVRGTLTPEDERAVAVVGTRSPTTYGREAAAALAGDLARCSITIVSGLALGVDTLAHRAALTQEGRTVAVVANGLDLIYPRDNASLARQIAEQGAVVSEYPLGTRPDPRGFPRRNRLISGMSLGTLVVEAGEKSGARWTVYHALEQNREVFCVPGSIFSPASRLTNRLIQDGAKLVSSHQDILEELNLTVVTRQIEMRLADNMPPSPDAEGEADLLRCLNHEPTHIDDIGRSASMPIAAVGSLLTILELKGLVKQVGAMHYIRIGEATPTYGN